tara:strand:+ start:427 stop:1014 length:588 start_codon:yes stop_codon:yes gene_type:complete
MSYDNIIENDYTINFHSGSLNEYTVNPVQSLGSLTVSTSPSSISALKNKTFTLTNTRGISKTYVFKNDPSLATGGLEGSEIIINLDSLTNESQAASEIKTAIESANGHNGTIVPTIIGTSKVVNLKQLIGGTDGDKNISLGGTMGTLMSKSNFTGGTNGSKPEHLPFRFSLRTIQNIRGQNEENYYNTFIGIQKD